MVRNKQYSINLATYSPFLSVSGMSSFICMFYLEGMLDFILYWTSDFYGGLIGVMYYVILQGELLTSSFSLHLRWPTAISFIRGECNSCHGRTCTSIIAHLISMLASDGRYTGSRIHDAHTLVRWKARPILYSILDSWLFLISSIQRVLQSVLCVRMLLHIRQVGQNHTIDTWTPVPSATSLDLPSSNP